MPGYVRSLLATAVLACLPLYAAAGCAKPEYPPDSLRDREQGISLVGFLVRTDGTVADTVLLNSSGHPALDKATADALSICVFKPAHVNGEPVERWVPVAYRWTIDEEGAWQRARRDAAERAKAGDLGALYHLSLLYSVEAGKDADRKVALVVLRSAAEQGHAHAMYDLGERYEKGDGVAADSGEALRWYRKSADKGDVLAIQRLQHGVQSD